MNGSSGDRGIEEARDLWGNWRNDDDGQENKLSCLNKIKHGDYEELLGDNDIRTRLQYTPLARKLGDRGETPPRNRKT